MAFIHMRVAGLTGLLLLSSSSMLPAAVSCTGIPAWSATTTYAAGAQVTYSGSLYKALVSTTNVQPNYCLACGWWQLVDTCDSNPTCTTVPSIPTGLSASAGTTTGVTLTWNASTAPAGCVVSYRVYQDGVQIVAPSTPSATITGLSPSTSYTFTVTAVDKAGSSAQSAGLTVATSGGGSSCAGVSAYVPGNVYWGNTQVTYNSQLWKAKWWTQNEAPSTGGSGVWQYLSDCSTVTCMAAPAVPTGLASSNVTATSGTLNWTPVAAPAGCIVSYKVYQNGILVQAPSSNTATISGLTANTSYSFSVASVDAAGTSAQGQALPVKTQPACNVPAPTGLASSNITSSGVTLCWTAVAPSAPGCSVTYKVFKSGTQIANQTGTCYTATGLSANTTFSFTIVAVDSCCGSSVSTAALTVTTSTVTCTAAPSVPKGLASPSQTSNSVNLAWSAATAGAGCSVTYNVYRNGSKVLTVPTTSAVVSGLAASTSYSFTVASVDSFGTSTQSAALSVKTKAEQDGPSANFDPATLAMLTANTGLNAEQWNNIMKLVSKPEQDDLDWVKYYGYCENINDGRGYTIGIFGATTGGSNDTGPDGPALFKEYDKVCGASSPSTAGGLARIGIQGYMSGSILNITESKASFTAHIKGMENVANWRTAMWNTFYSVYIGYCVEQMQARGFTTALTLGSFVDCALNQGAEGDSGSLEGMLSQTGNLSGEAAFMTQFYKVRTKVVDTHDYNQAPNGENRVKQWSTLLSQGETDLLNCDAQILSATNWVMQ